jgi:WD40 repeat protein
MRSMAFLSLILFIPTAVAGPGPLGEVRRDQDGAILPPGAIARLGSRLFRDPGAKRIYVDDSGRTVACFEDSAVRWWDLQTGRYLRGWAAQERAKVRFSPNGRLVGRGVPEGFEVRDTWNDRPMRIIQVDDPTRLIVAFSQDNRRIAVAQDEDVELGSYQVRVCDLRTGKEDTLFGLAVPPARFWFADSGRVLIVQDRADRVFGWEVGRDGFRWHVEASDLRFDRNSRFFIGSVGAEGRFALFCATTGQEVPRKDGLWQFATTDHVLDLSSRDATMLARCIEPDSTVVWSWSQSRAKNEKRTLVTFDDHGRPIGAFNPDGRRVVLLVDQRLHLYEVATQKRLTPDLPGWGQPEKPEYVYWSADGRRVFTAGLNDNPPGSGKVVVTGWDAVSGRVLEVATKREMERRRRLAERPYRPEPRVEIRRPTPRDVAGQWLPLSREHVYSIDGALVAIARMPGERGEFAPPESDVFGCRTRESYPRLVSPSVVEVATGRPLATLAIAYPGPFVFSPDARSLAVIEPDGVHLYDVLTGQDQLVRKVPMYPHSDPTAPCGLGMSFSPDGSRLAVIEHGGTVLVLDVALPRHRRTVTDDEMHQLWTDLASADPKVGSAAAFRLADDPENALRLLAERLTRVREPNIRRPLAELDSPDYQVRAAASAKLLALGDSVRPALAVALKAQTEPEPRQRLESLIAALADDLPPQSVDLRRLRALAVLERIGTNEARAKIDELAEGLAESRVTAEARRARPRLADRSGAAKD